MLENVRLAFQGIWSHKMRSFLTMLGIIIGIASIIAIVSTIQGTNNALRDQLVGSGNNTVNVTLSQGGEAYQIYDSSSIPTGIPVISDDTRQRILALDNVEKMTSYTTRFVSDGVYYKDKSLSEFNIYGIDMDYFDTLSYAVRTGREFLQEDYDNYHRVIVVDQTASENLFQGANPLGKTVEINSQPFTVIGVVYKTSTYEPDIQDLEDYYTNDDGSNGIFFMPKSTWPIVFQYDEPENVVVTATSTEEMTKAGQRTANILNEAITNKNSTITYSAEDLLGIVKQQQELANASNLQLVWIAGISLLVGGIGVMNIMLVSVTERTNEIGLKKAIGARKGAILWQFLTEAAVLTSLGGILGVAAGIAMSQLIHRFTGILVGINWPAALIAVLFSMVIGIVFGLLPSVQASNLDPIEALRRE
ncbi:MAG: ABC transporter permease [Lachnospiraceae bacterium]|nr:ABC transporter permease [Lachnospiraceae bacterium]